LSLALEGDPVALPLGDRLADEQPTAVSADLTVTYSGIRLHETLSDASPVSGAAGGFVVNEQPVVRAFPSQALSTVSPARVGLIGRVPVEDCELAVQFVTMTGDVPGEGIGAPYAITITAGHVLRTHWIDLPPGLDLSRGTIGISARANRGRFLWASDGTRPLIKLAVYDPDPGGRALRLNGTSIHTVKTGDEEHTTARTFPPALFRSLPPTFDSPLFLTVDVSDLALRYAR
jgi:hypothetical protein